VVAELVTPRLRLRHFSPADRTAFARFAGDEEYLRFLGPNHPDPDAFVDHNVAVDGISELAWVIVHNDAVVGSVFLGIEPGDEIGQVACLIDPAHAGRGVATEATGAVLAHAFGDLRLAKVWARADAANVGSIRAMEKLGLRREGTLRSHRLRRSGERGDEVLYGVTAADWRAGQ
jgi:RimJ/RimL family protein N-acetyltransferase